MRQSYRDDVMRLHHMVSDYVVHGYFREPDVKEAYHKLGAKVLRELRLLIGEPTADVRSCKGGPAVTGEITLHADGVYIQINGGSGVSTLMYRTCKGRTDYVGGTNNWGRVVDLSNEGMIATLAKMNRNAKVAA